MAVKRRFFSSWRKLKNEEGERLLRIAEKLRGTKPDGCGHHGNCSPRSKGDLGSLRVGTSRTHTCACTDNAHSLNVKEMTDKTDLDLGSAGLDLTTSVAGG